MTLQTAMLATLILILGAAQYALCVQAIRDLVRRPRVRGENKVLWAMVILCLPIGGAIVYNWMGPTSFIHRSAPGYAGADAQGAGATITPISAARSARRRRVAKAAHGGSPAPRKRTPNSGKIGRTGT